MALGHEDEVRLATLMRRVLAGDRQAEEALCREVDPFAYAIMRRLLDPHDSREAVQEALAKLIQRARSHPARQFHWTPTRPFGPWLFRFCENAGRDYARRCRRQPFPIAPETLQEWRGASNFAGSEPSLDVIGDDDDADAAADLQEFARVAWSCVDEMTAKQANAFKLWVRWNKTHDEIARELDEKTTTVGSLISRGSEKIRSRLAAEGFVLVGERSRGVRSLAPDCSLDLDHGRAGSKKVTPDLTWKRQDDQRCRLEPCGKARITLPAAAVFERLTAEALARLPYVRNAIDERRLLPGTILAAKTRSDNLAKLRVIGRDAALHVEWVTYTPRPAGSRVLVRLQAGLIVSCRPQTQGERSTTEGAHEQ